MDHYVSSGQEAAVTASLQTALHLTGVTTTRAIVYYASGAVSGTMADSAIRWLMQRFTVAPTSTPTTPRPKDKKAPVSLLAAGENASAEGTYEADVELEDARRHLRGFWVWQVGDYEKGGHLISNVAAEGIGIRVVRGEVGAYAETADAVMHHIE